jgi:membrane associated rhomboid family serine protease
MPIMKTGHEVESPAISDPPPDPARVTELVDGAASPAPAPPPPGVSEALLPAHPVPVLGIGCVTVESVLRAIVAANGPWFPSRFAAESGVPRDSLDDPLAELRLAGFVRVAVWERGAGQGYEPTPEGRSAVAGPDPLDRVQPSSRAARTEPVPAPELEAERAAAALVTPREEDLGLHPPVVVPALLMANALWFFVCAVVGIRWGLTPARALSEGHPEVLRRFGAVSGSDLLDGEWWRLITSCFVHFGALHLIVNLFALAMMGPLAELLWGRGRLVLIYFVSGFAGSALAMALRPDTVLAGASGAIWGIQMSLFAWLFAFRRHLPPDLAGDWLRRLCVVFALNAAVSFLPGVSWAGHLGGGTAGFVVAVLLNAARFGDRAHRLGAWVLIGLVPLLCVGGLAAAMGAKGIPGWQHLLQRRATAREEHEARAGREAAEHQRRLHEGYLERVAPRVRPLAPDAVRPLEANVGLLLLLKKRAPERVAEARAKVGGLRAAADALLRDTEGADPADRDAAGARAFAAARVRSCDLLLAMLAGAAPPGPAEWDAWEAARRDADRLWGELPPK